MPLTLESLRAANLARQAEWCPDPANQPDKMFRAVELGGEVGEALNVVKKLERERLGWSGSRATLDDLAQEIADIIICADLLAITTGIDLAAAVRTKFNSTSLARGLSVMLGEDVAGVGVVPEGWVLVPVDATAPMISAAEGVDWMGGDGDTEGVCHNVWHAILAARPQPPASPSVPVGEKAEIISADNVAAAMEDGRGFWRECSGCHELNDGYPTGRYSAALKCHVGLGCFECGGVGAIWDTTDYGAMGYAIADAPTTEAVSAEAVRVKPLEWVADHGDGYTNFRASTDAGAFGYGTDRQGIPWHMAPTGAFDHATEDDARLAAEVEHLRIIREKAEALGILSAPASAPAPAQGRDEPARRAKRTLRRGED